MLKLETKTRNLRRYSLALTVGGLLWCGYTISKNLFPDPILTAAEAGDTASVEALLNKGANIETTNGTGMTPLMRAAEFGHTETVKVLLAHGAKINASDDSGFTALRVAASPGGHAETVAFLLKSGAKPNVTDKEGRTALLWASAYGNAETVQTLIAHGADLNVRDRSDKTALLMAAGDKQELPSNPGNAESEKALRGAGARQKHLTNPCTKSGVVGEACPATREKALETLGYYQYNRERMNYPRYVEVGLQVGSGAVESGCKQLVTQRLQGAGMRWCEAGAQTVARLRCLLLGGEWHQFIRQWNQPTIA